MIVVDANIIAYLLIEGERTEAAEAVLRVDPSWSGPFLWRSEWRNVLAAYVRRGALDGPGARDRLHAAERLFRGREYLPDGERVLELAESSACSAYDCEYVAVAEALEVLLVTADRQLTEAFPGLAVSPETFRDMVTPG